LTDQPVSVFITRVFSEKDEGGSTPGRDIDDCQSIMTVGTKLNERIWSTYSCRDRTLHALKDSLENAAFHIKSNDLVVLSERQDETSSYAGRKNFSQK